MRRLAVLLLAGVALSGCGGSDGDPSPAPAAAPAEAAAAPGGVQELTNVLELRADFEADAGKTRVLLLFSPT